MRPTIHILIVLALHCAVAAAVEPIAFQDVTQRAGLAKLLTGWRLGHGGAWGDADGDGRPDLYIGAFADRPMWGRPDAPIPNLLLYNRPGGFVLSKAKALRFDGLRARCSSAIFVDLDNDGDLDLFVANHGSGASQPQNALFENLGNDRWKDVTPTKGDWPRPLGTRNVGAADFNRDGLPDLIVGDGNYSNWRSGGGKLWLLQNAGNFTFKDVTAALGLPAKGMAALGLALGDVNDDGTVDIFVPDCNRLFVSGGDGKYREAPQSRLGYFVKPQLKDPDAHTCGAAFGDLNGDGLLDLVTSEHNVPCTWRVYVNTGVGAGGMPKFENVTKLAGLAEPMKRKGTHLAIVDVDNDGRRDILTAMVEQTGEGKWQPVVFRNERDVLVARRQPGAVPHFSRPGADAKLSNAAAAPHADYDRDGRMDICYAAWVRPGARLFRNVTKGGHWLTVAVRGKGKTFNTMGIGATVRVYKPGQAGLLGRQDIVVGTGYAGGEEALATFGLGAAKTCDVEVRWQGRRVVRSGVAADQRVTIHVPEAQ